VVFAAPAVMRVGALLAHHRDPPCSRIPLNGEATDDRTTHVLDNDLSIGRARGEVGAPLGRPAIGSGALFIAPFYVRSRRRVPLRSAATPTREPPGEPAPVA
jgi:hypothetical protein